MIASASKALTAYSPSRGLFVSSASSWQAPELAGHWPPFFGGIRSSASSFSRRASDTRDELVIVITPRTVNRAEALVSVVAIRDGHLSANADGC